MKELILVCLKCGHHLCVGGWNTEKKMKEIMKMDCPECGEESGELWIISRFGDYVREPASNTYYAGDIVKVE